MNKAINTFNVVNFMALQVGWFLTCYTSGVGYPWVGPLFTLVWLSLHLAVVEDRYIDLRIVLVAALFGYLADSLLVMLQLISFPPAASFGIPTTVWMVSLWINLALTLRYCLGWMRQRYRLAAVAGAVLGPLAYYAGQKFSAILLSDTPLAIMAIAVEWLIAMPLLLWITEKSEAENGHFQQFILRVFSR